VRFVVGEMQIVAKYKVFFFGSTKTIEVNYFEKLMFLGNNKDIILHFNKK